MTAIYTTRELKRNIADAKKATYADPASYGRDGTRLLESVEEFLMALGTVEEFLGERPGEEFGKEQINNIAEHSADEWWCKCKVYRAMVGVQ